MPSPGPSRRSKSPSSRYKERRHRHSHGERSHSHRHSHRDRSRSPRRDERHEKHRSDRSHRRHDRDHDSRSHRHHHSTDKPSKPSAPVVLPLQARQLSTRDLEVFEPLLAMYLDIQKGHYIEDMSRDEVKGRWKSFMNKWNRAELAEGWYDPVTFERARERAAELATYDEQEPEQGRKSPDYAQGGQNTDKGGPAPPAADDDDEDDEYGPRMPHPDSARNIMHSGPTIPKMDDLKLQRELAKEDASAKRSEAGKQYRSDIQSHKAAMKNLEEEVAPRAEAGTRERQLEKRREVAASNRAFAEAGGASFEAVPESDLMGSGDSELAALKREKEQNQRKKNEREIRREEVRRAQAAEREERVQKYREKEQETMGWLQQLAKQRFG